MAISIRLARGGAKKRPYYRVVVADTRSPRDGKYLEQVGTYNPLLAKDDAARVKINEDRVRYWLGVGAQPTDRVARFLDAAGIKERAARLNAKKGEPGDKAKERAEEKAAKLAEAEEAAKAAEEAAKAPVEEAPVEAPAEEVAAEEHDIDSRLSVRATQQIRLDRWVAERIGIPVHLQVVFREDDAAGNIDDK